jgi:uncharacterized BrkB/YihY/UPF0761 family membrane protein
MANEKNKKDNSNHMANEAIEAFGKFFMMALAVLMAFAVMVLMSLSASLASMGERLRESGFSEGEIFKTKFWRLVGLLPFVLIMAYFTAQYIPKNISIKKMIATKSLDGVPTTETEYREIVESTKAKIERAE